MTTKFDWNETLNRLSALREEIEGGEEEFEAPARRDNDVVEGLSAIQIAALAEMLDVDPEELLQADEATIAEAMEYLGYKLVNSSYGRPGLSGKYPWSHNDSTAGHALQHASPSHDGEPGESTAKVPKESHSPMNPKPREASS